MNFTLDDDDMTQLDFADMRMHSHNFAIQVSPPHLPHYFCIHFQLFSSLKKKR